MYLTAIFSVAMLLKKEMLRFSINQQTDDTLPT